VSDGRKYPDRPYVGVGAVIVREGNVLLVKRKYEPLAGQWSLPGGAVEIGETLEACLVREMREETGLEVAVGPVIEVLDRMHLPQYALTSTATSVVKRALMLHRQTPGPRS
jgi:mutator protein MutT